MSYLFTSACNIHFLDFHDELQNFFISSGKFKNPHYSSSAYTKIQSISQYKKIIDWFHFLCSSWLYCNTCKTHLGIHAPLESFNRWLLERKVADRAAGLTSDPILSSDCENPVSPSMCREILNDIPVKLVKPKYVSDARRQLTKYAEGAKKIIESR